MRRTVLVLALLLAGCGGVAGCADHTSAGCGSNSCHLDLSDGDSFTLDGVKFTVDRVDDTEITFGSHGVSLTLKKSTDLSIGRYHLHLGDDNGSSAGVDITK
ncbi:hypothetical protein GXW83_22945 [Streptacidiphilus sp. PB12-B1b]|uniref:hypothetical protein n=1 Tax=Streptacidiphilus sp. PB12-B1b TaxID=2705012 RepID=UPI0015F86C20|nr:hypothetical protein [Streptacidiphilus sp. PB12-B1b]QMU78129.1 hypothetical protein GXW83_22945 [Streptacidiphilus sp. PB12-B1b]